MRIGEPETVVDEQAIIGWRTWRLVRERAGLRLTSVLYDETWPPRVAVRARCLGHDAAHDAPSSNCECGIYATRTPERPRKYLLGRNDASVVRRLIGEVALWGVVVAAADGWRAEYAYPQRIFVPDCDEADEIAAALAEYGVVVQPAQSPVETGPRAFASARRTIAAGTP